MGAPSPKTAITTTRMPADAIATGVVPIATVVPPTNLNFHVSKNNDTNNAGPSLVYV